MYLEPITALAISLKLATLRGSYFHRLSDSDSSRVIAADMFLI